jgi:cellulose synthase/poly-beta-1,6-N-acetylglucosamine synthase-like glycosyltransferase
MLDGIASFWYQFPILLILGTFGVGLLLRLTTKVAQPTKDYAWQPRVSILLPVFNEGAHVMETIASIVGCDWPADRLEIIAYDDCSNDDSWDWIQQAAARWPQVRAFRNAKNSGKHVTLARALGESSGEVLICIDSDCIFDRRVIRELVACFADASVGAVGGNIGISNVNTNVFTVCQTLVYYFSFQVGKMLQNLSGHVFCISGCLFAVRRALFEEVEHEVKSRNWFGLGVRDGEDRYMTHAIMMRGWKTICNPQATCWTAAPDNLPQLFNQQIRWRRSGLRDLFWTWRRIPAHLRILGLGPLLAALVPETFTALWAFLLLARLVCAGLSDVACAVFQSMSLFSGAFVVTAVAYNLTCKKSAQGNVKVRSPLLAALSGAWFLMDAILITLLALFTFDVGVWGTREKPAEPATSSTPSSAVMPRESRFAAPSNQES